MKTTFFFISTALTFAALTACETVPQEENESTTDQKEQFENEGEHHHKGHHHGHHHGDANAYMNQSDFQDLVDRFESPERDEYQQPDKVLKYLGDLQDKTVMDIGAGTGYFSFRMAEAGAKVIAADVDERFQEYIANKRDSLGISEEKLSLRELPYDSPDLAESEVDMVIIVNTYHHIENRVEYFEEVRKGLKEGGELVVIDFFKEETPVGPPVEMKIPADRVAAELQKAGFSKIEVERDLLPYQFLVRAGGVMKNLPE